MSQRFGSSIFDFFCPPPLSSLSAKETFSHYTQVKELCKEWFPIQYPEGWYRDITSDPRFYSLAAVYQSQLIGLLIAEVKHSESINKEVRTLDGSVRWSVGLIWVSHSIG